jgi:bile acid:Na+ symporter, BASS family
MSSEAVSIHFSPDSLIALNVCLAFIMFGVALEMKAAHFTQLLNQKKAVLTGLFSQIILLPFITLLLVLALPISNGMALGMILVAACPGGNVSNFFSMLAKGNVGLSVTLTAFSSLLSFAITPLNFFFWASLAPHLITDVKELQIDILSLTINMLLILLLPLFIGMWMAKNFPAFTLRIGKGIRLLSIIILITFIVIAFSNNQNAFTANFVTVFWIVLLHNGTALLLSYLFSASLKNDEATNRTVAIETGIQNSGLGLILIFTFFNGNTEMALVAAWWGIWHLVSGFGFSLLIRHRPILIAVK